MEATAAWKVAYAVGSVLRNTDQTRAWTAEFALTQTGPWILAPGGPSAIVATQNATVPPGSSTPVSFGLFTQNWGWFEQATGTPYGTTFKFVSYSLSVTLTDASGSKFNITSLNLIVLVSVASYKITDQEIAQQTFAQAVQLGTAAALSWEVPPLAAFAAAAIAARDSRRESRTLPTIRRTRAWHLTISSPSSPQ